MNDEERELMMKMAKQMDVLEGKIKEIEKKLESEGDKNKHRNFGIETIIGEEANEGDPDMIMTSKFSLNKSTIIEQSEAQKVLKSYIIEFCKKSGIEELRIFFKEKK